MVESSHSIGKRYDWSEASTIALLCLIGWVRCIDDIESIVVLEIVDADHELVELGSGDSPNRSESEHQETVKVFPHLFLQQLMNRQDIYESLLSSSTKYIQDRKGSYDGDQDMRRLKRKIIPSLPQQQAADTGEVKGQLWRIPIFNPQSSFIIAWQVLNIFLIYIYFMQIPIAIAFGDHRSGNQTFFITINYPVMAIFILDIFVNLNTSFYMDGQLQKAPAIIRRHYLTKSLAYDTVSLLAIFFYEMVQRYNISKDVLKFVVLVFFLRLKELLRIERVIINSFDLNRRVKATIKLLLLLMKILLICNVVACGGFMLSDYLSDIKAIPDPREQTCGSSSYWIISTCEADRPLKYIQSFPVKYIYSLYWASTTMISIGYGDITPQNSYEVGYTIIMQFLSCLLYGYAINEIWSIILELNSKKFKIHTRLNTINIYMRDKEIGSDLTNRINGYLNNYYYAKNLRQRDLEGEIIGELTPSLKRELFFESYSIVMNHRFFSSFHEGVIIEASQHIKEVCFYEDQTLTESQQLASSCLYYLKKGELRFQAGGKARVSLQAQFKGDYIGLFQFITQLPYISELTAVKYSLAYYMRYAYWRKALKEDQPCFEYFNYVRERLMLYHQLDTIGYRCYFCTLHTHRSEICFDNFIRAEIHRDIQKIQKNADHKRRSYIRRKTHVHLLQKRQRKWSFNRSPEAIRRYDSVKVKITSNQGLDQILPEYENIRKISSDVEEGIVRSGRVYGKHHHKHETHKALERVQMMYVNREEEESEYRSLQIEIKSQETDIDVLATYDEYYPAYNLTELVTKDERKRRVTKSFY